MPLKKRLLNERKICLQWEMYQGTVTFLGHAAEQYAVVRSSMSLQYLDRRHRTVLQINYFTTSLILYVLQTSSWPNPVETRSDFFLKTRVNSFGSKSDSFFIYILFILIYSLNAHNLPCFQKLTYYIAAHAFMEILVFWRNWTLLSGNRK
jgi:hypothetical protein